MEAILDEQGFALNRGFLETHQRDELLAALGTVDGAGRRGLLALPAVADLARCPRLLALARQYLPVDPVPVRGIYFDKSPGANWLVPWHQDLTLALCARVDLPGFGPWSVKDGIPHVQPPVALLEQMLAIRLHLDDADEGNGALRVLPGSHRFGRLTPDRIQSLRREGAEVVCRANAGDALVMRPLLLHASSRSTSLQQRRVLHLEYAGFALPAGLGWHEKA